MRKSAPMRMILLGYLLITVSSYCMSYFAETESTKFIALGGLIGAISGVLIVLRLVGDK